MVQGAGYNGWTSGRQNAQNLDLNRNFPDLTSEYYRLASVRGARGDHIAIPQHYWWSKVGARCRARGLRLLRDPWGVLPLLKAPRAWQVPGDGAWEGCLEELAPTGGGGGEFQAQDGHLGAPGGVGSGPNPKAWVWG